MIATKVNFDNRSMQEFAALIDESIGTIKRTPEDAVKFATGTLLRSVAAATPPSRTISTLTKRRVLQCDDPRLARADKRMQSYLTLLGSEYYGVEVLAQGGRRWIKPIGSKEAATASVYRTIARRKLAKRAWWFAWAKAKAKGDKPDAEATGGQVDTLARSNSDGSFTANNSAGVAEAQVANQLGYIVALDQGGPHNPPAHIMATALPAAVNRMEWLLTQQARKVGNLWNTKL